MVISYIIDQNVLTLHQESPSSAKKYLRKLIASLQFLYVFAFFYFTVLSAGRSLHIYFLACAIKPTATLPYAMVFFLALALGIYMVLNYQYNRWMIRKRVEQDFTATSSDRYKELVETASEAHEEQEKIKAYNDSINKSNVLATEMPILDEEIERIINQYLDKLHKEHLLPRSWWDARRPLRFLVERLTPPVIPLRASRPQRSQPARQKTTDGDGL